MENSFYILPHEANGIIKYSINDDSYQLINNPDEAIYTLRPNEGFSGYDVLRIDDMDYVIPYMGNQILKINDEGVIAEVLPIEMRIADVYAFDFNNLNYESEISSLEGYINWVNNNKVDTKILKLKELDQFFSNK